MYEEAPDRQRGKRLAAEILHALRERREAGEIVLGGYLALERYLGYRITHDADAGRRGGPLTANAGRERLRER